MSDESVEESASSGPGRRLPRNVTNVVLLVVGFCGIFLGGPLVARAIAAATPLAAVSRAADDHDVDPSALFYTEVDVVGESEMAVRSAVSP